MGERYIALYRDIAVIVLNTVLFCGLLAAIYWGATWAFTPSAVPRHPIKPGVNNISRTYGINPAPAYPDLSLEEVDELLAATWGNRELVFSPFVAFREREYNSRFLNVDEFGIRRTSEGLSWPPGAGPNIFVFGGSTTFGYGVTDQQTIPAQLGILTGSHVYNLGCGYYYSSQERALFQKLLARGIVPERAIFIDGLNEFGRGGADLPEFTEKFCRLTGTHREAEISSDAPKWRRAIELYLRNKKLIEAAAREFGVKTLFVWQPIRAFRFNRAQDLFKRVEFIHRDPAEQGYIFMERLFREGHLGINFLWLAETHNQVKWPYIDKVHYSPAMCASLARVIAQQLKDDNAGQQESQ